MRIDDRKVNGRITIDAIDVVNGFTIAMIEDELVWVTDASGVNRLDPGVAVSQLNSVLDAVMAIRFTIIIANRQVYKVITSPNYTIDDGITIDISTVVSGKELKIDLETGQLSVVAITNT